MENILVIDVGTSSLKAMLYNCGGALLFHAQQEYHSEFGHNNYVEQKPLSWQEALIVTLKNAAKFVNDHGITPAAIAVTSQRASVIPVNSNGEPLYNALMWQDKRSIDQCKKISSELTLTAINRKTGLRLDPYFPRRR